MPFLDVAVGLEAPRAGVTRRSPATSVMSSRRPARRPAPAAVAPSGSAGRLAVGWSEGGHHAPPTHQQDVHPDEEHDDERAGARCAT